MRHGLVGTYDRLKQAAMLETDRPHALRQAIMACCNGGTVSVAGVYGGCIDKLLFGKAFRPPNLYEQYYAYSSVGIRSVASPRLDAERITTYEAVLERGLWDRALATLTAYRYDIDGLIEQTRRRSPAFDGVTLQYRNNGAAQANGAEAELSVPLPRRVLMRAAYSLQEARDENGRLLSNSPKHLGRLGVSAPLAYGLGAGAELLLVSPRHTFAGRLLETARIINVNLTYDTPVRDLRLSAGFFNVLNQSYPDPGGAEHRQDRIPQDGLTFRVQARYAF